jgi:hypothetical protein
MFLHASPGNFWGDIDFLMHARVADLSLPSVVCSPARGRRSRNTPRVMLTH